MRTGWIIAAALLFVPRAGALAAPGDACTLLTDMQVSTALGVTVGAGTPIGSPTSCQWAGKGKIATLTANDTVAGKSAVERFDAGKTSTLPGIKVEPIRGVGDDAYYVYYSGTTRSGLGLVVKKGRSAFEVRVYGFEIDQAKTVAKTLAQNVAGRL
jgi:hypothetical protein